MKRLNTLLLTLILIICFSFAADAASIDEAKDDPVAAQYVIPILKALQSKDLAAIYSLWSNANVTEETNASFQKLFDAWNGEEVETVKRTSAKKRPQKGDAPAGITYTYDVTCKDKKRVIMELDVLDAEKTVNWFQIKYAPQVTGALSTWRQFTPLQWLVTALAAAELVFSLFIAVLCFKRKPKLWGIWLVFIVMIYGGVAISISGALKLSFYVSLLSFPKLLIYQNVGTQLSISAPVGAVVYWLKYKKMHKEHIDEQRR